jgi:glyoxylase-like metal-dependent hydrolase (beta-lactamase superfamily II)
MNKQMIEVKKFTFNPFQENTYVLSDDSAECVIIDPGCFNGSEQRELSSYVAEAGLRPVRLLNTHAHIDHVLGNKFVAETYGLSPEMYQSEYDMLEMAKASSALYGIPYDESPMPLSWLKEGDVLEFGTSSLEVLFVPGHAPDHVVFFNKQEKLLIGGDVLFRGSIGRTDLPGGNHQQLLDNIKTILFPLDDDVVVYSGHGDETTIGEERRNNPFF